MSYRYDRKRKAKPRAEWDEFLLYVRQQFGCDSKTIHSNYRVERRYLAHSMKLVVYCDHDPPATGEFELGYIEIHEGGIVSYEYADWLKECVGVPGEVALRQSDQGWREQADNFLAGLRREADSSRERARSRERLKLAAAERQRLEDEARKAEEERQRLAEEAERRRVRRMKEAQRRERQRAERAERERLEEIARAERARLERARWVERQRQLEGERAERAKREAARRAEEARLEAIEDARLERKRAREARWRRDAEERRRAFAEVGIVIPPDEELAKLLEPEPPGPWRPHPGDLVLTAGGIAGLLYWLLFL